jgi:BioD-like phosphotransacetylase family protein
MREIVMASMRKGAGKTSMIVGIGRALGRKIGYMKPFGDRLLYRKKRLWDYDSALISNVFGLDANPEDVSLGFDHAKLSFMDDAAEVQRRVVEAAERIGKGRDLVFIEGGRDMSYGASVHMDPVSIARCTKAALFAVVDGDGTLVLDDISFLGTYVAVPGVSFGGVIVNKVRDLSEFRELTLPRVEEMGIPVVGVVPFEQELTYLSVGYIAEGLFAKVITGEQGMGRSVKTLTIGAMSQNAALESPLLKKRDILVITSGDRSEIILIALENNASAVLLTNDILPPPNIIALAEEKKVPLLLVPFDTYETARQVDGMMPLLGKDETGKIDLLTDLAKKHVRLEAFGG